MNDQERLTYKDLLLRMRTELLETESMARESSRPVTLDQAAVGRVSRIDAIQSQQMSLASSRRRQGLLAAVESALRRIESGEFGCCFACGEEIAPGRLRADPTCTRCVACAQRR